MFEADRIWISPWGYKIPRSLAERSLVRAQFGQAGTEVGARRSRAETEVKAWTNCARTGGVSAKLRGFLPPVFWPPAHQIWPYHIVTPPQFPPKPSIISDHWFSGLTLLLFRPHDLYLVRIVRMF